LAVWVFVQLWSNPSSATEAVPVITNSGFNLSVVELVHRVLQRNDSLQEKLLTLQANRHKYLAEKGIFEPEAFASADREVNKRQNNTLQAAAANNVSELEETNTAYNGGLEASLFSGARVKLGYNLSDLRNNVPIQFQSLGISSTVGDQWQTFFGLTITQPLLKNFGPAATMAAIRVSALSSKIAFQEYRRELLTLVSSAEATYWNLYLAQEQVHLFEESVKTAGTILRDNQTRLEAGKGSALDVLEARAGLGLRQAKLEEARQKLVEAANRVLSLYAETASLTNPPVHAVDSPAPRADTPNYQELGRKAFELNPDYLIQQEKMEQERVRLGFARNQILPEVNLKGAYGLNGLGATPGDSWGNVSRSHYPSWSVGLEFRMPIIGGMKARNELNAALLTVQASELALRSLETQMLNGMDSAWHKALSTRRSVENYRETVKYNESLMEASLVRLDAGKIESRKVLEIEADLLEARNSVAESLVRDEIAHLELEVIEGVLLQQRNLEITQKQLEAVTRKFSHSAVGDAKYRSAMEDIQRLYQDAGRPDDAPSGNPESLLRRKLKEQTQEADMRDERNAKP